MHDREGLFRTIWNLWDNRFRIDLPQITKMKGVEIQTPQGHPVKETITQIILTGNVNQIQGSSVAIH